MADNLLVLDSLSFTIESIKLADAERRYYEHLYGGAGAKGTSAANESGVAEISLSQQVAKAREQIQSSLKNKSGNPSAGGVNTVDDEIMREENARLRKDVENLQNQLKQLTDRVAKLEVSAGGKPQTQPPPPAKADSNKKVEDDDDVDLFGSDEEEDTGAAELREKRLAEYAAKKSKKPALVAKSNVILDIKPWDDETDMKVMETEVRKIEMEGLLWGSSKLVPLAYGIKKLQIATVIEDDKVSVDELTEKIQDIEDFVQSVDIAAFNKI